jgi:hypothetical protein
MSVSYVVALKPSQRALALLPACVIGHKTRANQGTIAENHRLVAQSFGTDQN